MIEPLNRCTLQIGVLASYFLSNLVPARTQSILITDFAAVGDSNSRNPHNAFLMLRDKKFCAN